MPGSWYPWRFEAGHTSRCAKGRLPRGNRIKNWLLSLPSTNGFPISSPSPPARANEPAAELEKLRAQASGLRAQKDNLEKQAEEKAARPPGAARSKPGPHPPEYYQEKDRLSAGKTSDGRILGIAFAMYAMDHDGRFPSTMDEVATYCGKEDMILTGTNEFEILFKGSTANLKVPRGEVIVCRDRQTWGAPSGKMARIYITADGAVQTIESDDNFQAYESAHIISR